MEPRRSNASHSTATSSPVTAVTGRGGSSNILNTVLVVLVSIAALVTIIFLGSRLAMATTGGAVKGKQYQAVFLTNGQVYFGKLKNPDSAYVKLTDIYYLQVQQTVQPDQQKEDANKQPNVSLAKLGSELHGPEDTMYISRDQILFWENLKDDGKVAQAIKDYQSGAKK